MKLASELELATAVAEARAGSESSFSALVRHYEPLVYAVCLRIVKLPELAQDSTQETFIAAWRNIATAHSRTFRGWLCTIAANTSRSELRRIRRRSEVSLGGSLGFSEAETSVDVQVLQRELRGTLDHCLDSIPVTQRDALVLWHFAGLDYSTIASITGVPAGTVKSRIARGRRELARLLLVNSVQKTNRELST